MQNQESKSKPADSEQGHMIGSKIHDQWCARCDKFRGIPCAENPKYDKP